VAHAVISYLLENDMASRVERMGERILTELRRWQSDFPYLIKEVRGRGLLIALEMSQAAHAEAVFDEALRLGLFVNVTQGNIVRLFPALTITEEEVREGLALLRQALEEIAYDRCG
jgi:acetylornithine/N-succinyldiaminopimelate aminotransferase